jgi:hypothetical protein
MQAESFSYLVSVEANPEKPNSSVVVIAVHDLIYGDPTSSYLELSFGRYLTALCESFCG